MATSRATKLEDWAVAKGMPRLNAGGLVRAIEALAGNLSPDARAAAAATGTDPDAAEVAAWNAAIPQITGALQATMAIEVEYIEMIDVLEDCGYISQELSASLRGITEPAGDA